MKNDFFLMTENRPECSIKTFNGQLISQRLFKCNTCKFEDCQTMCESCAKFCHQNHEIIDLGFHIGYCMCGYGFSRSYCFLQNPIPGDLEIPKNESRQCNFLKTGRRYERMEMFHCRTCGISGSNLTCKTCSKLCHKDHDVYFHRVGDAFCDCGDPSSRHNCLISPPNNPPSPLNWCTYLLTSNNFLRQKSFRCLTCGMSEEDTICSSCANYCHNGHNLVEHVYDECYCDCGAGTISNFKCKILNEIDPSA